MAGKGGRVSRWDGPGRGRVLSSGDPRLPGASPRVCEEQGGQECERAVLALCRAFKVYLEGASQDELLYGSL